jgi:hypothetical protein
MLCAVITTSWALCRLQLTWFFSVFLQFIFLLRMACFPFLNCLFKFYTYSVTEVIFKIDNMFSKDQKGAMDRECCSCWISGTGCFAHASCSRLHSTSSTAHCGGHTPCSWSHSCGLEEMDHGTPPQSLVLVFNNDERESFF